MVDGRTFDFRQVMKEIVRGYPTVKQQKEIFLRDIAMKLKDENGKPIHKTAEMLLSEKYVDDQTEFEKKLIHVFNESPDTLELIKIFKRKLKMNDPKNSTRNLAILEEMLAREPLHKFILFAKNAYCSNEIFEQIAQIEKY